MRHLPYLKEAVKVRPAGKYLMQRLIRYESYREHETESALTGRTLADCALFEKYPIRIYEYDRVAGSFAGCFTDGIDDAFGSQVKQTVEQHERYDFWGNTDHFAPNFERLMNEGIAGTMKRIDDSLTAHRDDGDRTAYLSAMKKVLGSFSAFIARHAEEARRVAGITENADCRAELTQLAADLDHISREKPQSFRQALNLTWLVQIALQIQEKYATALGRIDQYLYPFYRHDRDAGLLTDEECEDLLACTFIKIGEYRWKGGDNVVNICIGGVTPDGEDAINDLSYCVLHAVRDCNIPGPNLSARLHDAMPDRFLDECLQVIGTGLGYPALMNDRANIPALMRYGYTPEDARNHCFVGCIENFIQGKQPAWSDGRFNVPQMLEAVFHRGRSAVSERFAGIDTGDVSEIGSMDEFMNAFKKQIEYAARNYVDGFNDHNGFDRTLYPEPFMSLFCDDCIDRGMDINAGGAHYPSVHGAGAMGIATIADSLAAIEKVVFTDHACTLAELRDALAANFEGYETLRAKLKAAPKYGNNDDFVDKYAVWYVEYISGVFKQYRTNDGGHFYIGIASNTANVPAGRETGATPNGREAGVPISDAASPTYGADQNGPTSAFLSLSKPDYSYAALGTVVNQKYTTDMLRDPTKRAALLAAIRTYFKLGGQEVQINCVDRAVLIDAREHPENYGDLVVRVSGFSAYYIKIGRDIQEDILHRTEHAEV